MDASAMMFPRQSNTIRGQVLLRITVCKPQPFTAD
jgi:hypothetical protein